VVGRILAPAISKVGRERRLGQHGIVGNLIEASRGRSGSSGDPVRSGAVGAVGEGGQPVGEEAGVRVVLGEAPVELGDGRSDTSTWMASTVIGVDGDQ
jgi:hypothetical protein